MMIITWKEAWRKGLDLNQNFVSTFSIMNGRKNIPGAAMLIQENTTYNSVGKILIILG